jgi:hypothetical protein
MQQGFGIILLADEIVRERRAAAEAAGRIHRVPRTPRTDDGRGRRPGRRRIAIRIPRFVLALTLVPTRRRAPAD